MKEGRGTAYPMRCQASQGAGHAVPLQIICGLESKVDKIVWADVHNLRLCASRKVGPIIIFGPV